MTDEPALAVKAKAPTWPRGPFTVGKVLDEVACILDRDGNDVMNIPGGAERLVACANAIRHDVHFPGNHVAVLEERVERLEKLRKDAWARAEALQAKVDAGA